MKSDKTPSGLDEIIAEGSSVVVNGTEVNRGNIHYMDDLLTVLLDDGVFVRDKHVHLTVTEHNLLKALTKRPDEIQGKTELLNEAWGIGQGSEYSLMWHIRSLRKKIEDNPQRPNLIRSFVTEGYKYVSQGKIKVQADPERDFYKPLYQDDYLVIFGNHTIRANGHEIKLSVKEYKLLKTLVSRPNETWKNAELIKELWGVGQGSEDSLKAYIKLLRKKVEQNPKAPGVIINHHGQGYSFNSQGNVYVNVYAPIPTSNRNMA